MKMGLYKLFSCNVEIQYKSYFLSKAMLFTILTTMLTIILPFALAYRSRGFWLKTHDFYEQPIVHFTYDYLVMAETEDPSQPVVCGEAAILNNKAITREESCAEIHVKETDFNEDSRNELIDINFKLIIPAKRSIASVTLLLALDFQLTNLCPLHMQSLAIITRDFVLPPSSLKYFGDLKLYQVAHLPCLRHHIDTKYNTSIFNFIKDSNENILDFILRSYFNREVTTQIKTLYSTSQNGNTGSMDINLQLRIPEVHVTYIPSLLQELKWAWPQYLSLAFIFYWIFHSIKKFVFNNRLLMAWEVIPWKKQ